MVTKEMSHVNDCSTGGKQGAKLGEPGGLAHLTRLGGKESIFG